MTTVTVAASRQYAVRVGEGLLSRVGESLRAVLPPCTAAVISDDTVDAVWGDAVRASLRGAGYRPVSFTIPHGEGSKDLSSFCRCMEFLSRERLDRGDVIVALGGGVVGDLAGFCAASYLRGISWVQLPTTLLAAVDASVGGKTGVNLPQGKNLCGAFWQPSLVLCDCRTLRALPEPVFRQGCAEVIKTALLGDPALFSLLEEADFRDDPEPVVARCVRVKAALVARDEFDAGERQLLNLGHTVGHALELLSGYALSHGEAVAMGLAVICRAAAAKGCCSREVPRRTEALLGRYGLPTGTDIAPEVIRDAALRDKKLRGGTLTLAVPEEIGRCALLPIPAEELTDWIRAGAEP